MLLLGLFCKLFLFLLLFLHTVVPRMRSSLSHSMSMAGVTASRFLVIVLGVAFVAVEVVSAQSLRYLQTPAPTNEIPPTPTNEIPPTPTNEIPPTPTNEIPPTPTNEIPPTPTNEIPPTPTNEIPPTPTNKIPATVSPSVPYSKSSGSHGSNSSLSDITVSPTEVNWVDVFFEVTDATITPEVLVYLLHSVLWNNEDVDMVPQDVLFPWIRISFHSAERAREALVAANTGELGGVVRAEYEIPVEPSTKNDTFLVLAVVIPIVVFLLIIIAGVVVYFTIYRKKETTSRRFDEDFAMNCMTTPVDLNELLLSNRDQRIPVEDEVKGLSYRKTKSIV